VVYLNLLFILLLSLFLPTVALSDKVPLNQLTQVQFQGTADAGGLQNTFTLHFNQPAPQPQLYLLAEGKQLVMDINATVAKLSSPLPPVSPPVEAIQIASSADKTRLLFSLQHPMPHQLQQREKKLLLSFSDPTSVQTAKSTTIDLSLDQEPIASALKKIVHAAGQNLLLNGEPSGTTSMQLQQVDWRVAFDLIIEQNQLQLSEQNGILIVSPPSKEEIPITAPSIEQPPQAVTLETVMIPLHYAHAADLKKSLESSDNSGLLSPQGALGIDERTNTLIIREQQEKLEQIQQLISALDRPTKQVLIESRIVIAANDFSSELGARLGITAMSPAQQQWGFSLSGSNNATNSALSGQSPGIGGENSRLAVNLPITSAAGSIGLTLAKLSSGNLIDLELSAAQLEGKTEIVANPRIITSNGYEATIQQGVQIPYRSDTLSGGTDVSFKDAVMELRVTPQITPDHHIILTLQVKKDAVGTIFCDNCEPSVDTREVKTRVMIGDGETLVIGGIYEERKTDAVNRVPLLADLPIIGQLFQSQRETDGKGELLIFITPSILKEPT
jgi:type IV pilus assembly protein PilQ